MFLINYLFCPQGLINVLEVVVPCAEHRHYVIHLYRNFWQKHKGSGLRKLVWNAAKTTNPYVFQKAMEVLKKKDKSAYE